MDVFAKFKPRARKNSQPDQAPSKAEILSTMENYAIDKSQANKENNNNSDPLSRGSSVDAKWELVDNEFSTPASLTHSYSLEWDKLFTKPSMMRNLKEKAMEGNLRSSRFRSVVWKLFLEVLPPNMDDWIKKTRENRCKFEELKNKLIVNPRKAVDSVDITLNNPLSQDEESPWNKFFQDNELRLTIKQDVIRTYPKIEFFQSNQLRNLMVNILFIFAKENTDLSYRQVLEHASVMINFLCQNEITMISRVFPEVQFFRAEHIGEMMLDILFCYSREHATNSYKQGMHELLAPLIFVLHCDHQAFLHACEMETVLEVMKEVMDPAYLEHDAYIMFCQVMETVEPWYLSRDIFMNQSKNGSMRNLELINATPFSKSQDLNPSNAIVTKLTRIQDYILKKFDPELHQHLERLEIAPQIYGIRWLRLLFGREFPMQDLLMLWDAIFGDGIGFDLVDYIFVAMLQYIRDVLLTSDYATCLTVLMKYPPVADVHYFVVKALWLREPNQYPRPPNYTHQGSIGTSISMGGSADSINNFNSNNGAGKNSIKTHTRHHSLGQKRQNNMLGGFSSFSRKFSRPRTLAVPKSSSEPMNLQTDISPDHADNPIGSTVSLSHVEESMFRHAPSASSLARLESSNLRSAQSSPGVHPSSMFPLTPDDASISSSPTKYNTLPGKPKGKPKKMTKVERELQEKITHLQGELNDKKTMCRYCSSKLDEHISRLQQDLSRQKIEVDDDIMLSLAGLKLVRDFLNGTLKFSQTIADDDEEIQISDNYYGNQYEGGDNYSTGINSPESDILLGATSGGDDYQRASERQRAKLFYMSSEEINSPDSHPSSNIPGKPRGGNAVELNEYHTMADNVTSDDNVDNRPDEKKHLFVERDRDSGVGAVSGGKDTAASPPLFASKIRSIFRSDSASDRHSKQSEVMTVSSKVQSEHLDGSVYSGRRRSNDSQAERELTALDLRRRAKSNVENASTYWPDFVSAHSERRSFKGSHSGLSDEDVLRGGGRQEDEQRIRERSKSQPSAYSGNANHPLYRTGTGENFGVNPLYRLRYPEDMEH